MVSAIPIRLLSYWVISHTCIKGIRIQFGVVLLLTMLSCCLMLSVRLF